MMATKTKRKAKSGVQSDIRLPFSGGDSALETDGPPAATNQLPSERPTENEVHRAGHAAGESSSGSGSALAGCKNNRRSTGKLKSIQSVNGEAGGDGLNSTERNFAASPKTNGHATPVLKTESSVHGHAAGEGEEGNHIDSVRAETCRTLQSLQRRRAAAIKSRTAIDNQLGAIVATELGYFAGMSEEDRKARRKLAGEIVKLLANGDEIPAEYTEVAARVAPIVASTRLGRDGFDRFIKAIEKEMIAAAQSLPVAAWAESIRGFGLLRLAVIIGETGDLSLYSNPGKIWKRMGCAPADGKMPSTWRRGKEGKLSAEQWTEIGYSPRRRSIMFVVTDLLVKLNDGEYRARYDEAKANAGVAHPDWAPCRVNAHGHLLMGKRLLRNLWIEWRKEAAHA